MTSPYEIPTSRNNMACPYFMPVEKLENGNWPHPSRLPLGCGWHGHCTAPGHEKQIPPQDVLEAFCNLGYASSCEWAPRERSCDSMRFAVAAPSGAGEHRNRTGEPDLASRTIRVTYVCERSHRPVLRGELEFDLEASLWLRPHDDSRIQKMAECFLESYLRKKPSV
jgi:hypothetical protein